MIEVEINIALSCDFIAPDELHLLLPYLGGWNMPANWCKPATMHNVTVT